MSPPSRAVTHFEALHTCLKMAQNLIFSFTFFSKGTLINKTQGSFQLFFLSFLILYARTNLIMHTFVSNTNVTI